MELISKELILKEIPLFAELSDEEIGLIRERAYLKEYKKGQAIYQEGSSPSAFYCVVTGRVVIFTRDLSGNRTVLEYLHRGKYFGIISLLTDETHSVSAEAINDSLLLEIKKEDFDLILKKVPGLAVDLSRTLSRRLKRKDIHQKTIFESTVISVFSSYSRAGKTLYALNLSLALKKETHKSVVILDLLPEGASHSLPKKLDSECMRIFNLSGSGADDPSAIKDFILRTAFGLDVACFYYRPQDSSCVKRLIAIISILVNDYHYILLDLPSAMDRPVFDILNQSDLIHLLTSPEPVDLGRTRHLVERLRQEFSFQEEKIKVIINEYKLSKLAHEEQTDLLGRQVFATLPRIELSAAERLVLDEPHSEYSRAIRRIARQLGDCLVGLVLGVGVGYGFCHIGVLRVIEEEKIPVDVIVGSSIGALIASLWVTGRSSSEILEIAREFKEPKHIWNLIDLTFPLLGFIKGSKLQRFLKKHLDNKTFYDVRLPLKIIASDVRRKEPRVLDKGPLVDAIMASCAMPGVFAPFKLSEDMLFDGGVINPLPTEPLLKMGVKKIIAVNVTPSREDILRQYDRLKEKMTAGPVPELKKEKRPGPGERIKNIFRVNILDFIFSSIEILQSEVAKKEGQLADVVLHPDTSGLYWLDLHRSEEFARRGEEEARRNLDKIRQVINE
ncbi:MAG: cyclic nucleotide-binding domain-containing protein [Candidatus Omnitrophica bacterium]|nr:cyclic nucleotide-binding domain-containing protein [Candidatus Omnitrophota bacterium]